MKGALARTPPPAHSVAAAAAADSDDCADAAAAPVITSPLPVQQRHNAPQAVSPSAHASSQILSWRETMKEILHHTRKQ